MSAKKELDLNWFEPSGLDSLLNALKVSRATVRRDLYAAGGEDPTMIPDYLIIEEIRRRQQDSWEPEPLRLPLYEPHWPDKRTEESEEDSKSRIIIIDM